MLRSGLLHLADSPTAKALVTRTPLRHMSRRFVPGETVDSLVEAIRNANADGLSVTANYLGESEQSRESARAAARTYLHLLERIDEGDLDAGLSVKFTQLGQEIDEGFLKENLDPILSRAREAGIFVRFDMESSAYTRKTLDAFEELWSRGVRNIGVVLQSYLRRTREDVERMIELGAPVRLCKGAYDEPPEVAYQERSEVGRSFVRCMRPLLSHGAYPAIATHDEAMIEATLEHARTEGISSGSFEFQMLHGVRRDLQRTLVEEGYNVRVYIPFGESWYPYLVRRLAERPANLVFLLGSVLRESPLGVLWPDRRDGREGSG